MRKTITAGLTALFISAPPLVLAPSAIAGEGASGLATELKGFTDTRVEIIKAALQMTPTQEKLWPPVEDAIRARVNARHARLVALAAARNDDREREALEILRDRADALALRAANLKKLVDAWQPLNASLDTRQKLRLRFVSALALREMKDTMASRFWETEDEDENE